MVYLYVYFILSASRGRNTRMPLPEADWVALFHLSWLMLTSSFLSNKFSNHMRLKVCYVRRIFFHKTFIPSSMISMHAKGLRASTVKSCWSLWNWRTPRIWNSISFSNGKMNVWMNWLQHIKRALWRRGGGRVGNLFILFHGMAWSGPGMTSKTKCLNHRSIDEYNYNVCAHISVCFMNRRVSACFTLTHTTKARVQLFSGWRSSFRWNNEKVAILRSFLCYCAVVEILLFLSIRYIKINDRSRHNAAVSQEQSLKQVSVTHFGTALTCFIYSYGIESNSEFGEREREK